MPRRWWRSILAAQSASLLGARLPFPHPDRLPGRQYRMPAAGSRARERRLRQRARLVVPGFDSVSKTVTDPADAETVADHGGFAGRLPAGAAGAVNRTLFADV